MENNFNVQLPDKDLREKALKVRNASNEISQANDDERKNALSCMANSLIKNADRILEANNSDFGNVKC